MTVDIFDYWFPWYPAHFKRDTVHLSLEEDAIYRRLIDYYMETRQALPDDMNALARIVGCDVVTIEKAWEKNLSVFFGLTDGFWHSKKCDAILAEQDARADKNKKNGSKGGRPKGTGKQKEKTAGLAKQNPNKTTGQDNTGKKVSDSNKLLSSCTAHQFVTKSGQFMSFEQVVDFLWKSYPRVGRTIRHKDKFKAKIETYLMENGKNGTDWETLASDLATKIAEFRRYCEATGEKQPDPFRWMQQNGFNEDYKYQESNSDKHRTQGKGNPSDALRIAVEDQSHRTSID
jgi:uncharacterized protein YdaU (DUF1376 family)